MSNLHALKPKQLALTHQPFKHYEPGYVHVDVKYLPQMQDESSRRCLFAAIDRATLLECSCSSRSTDCGQCPRLF